MTRKHFCFYLTATVGLLSALSLITGCGGGGDDSGDPPISFTFDFAYDQGGFGAGFTDLPADYNRDIYNLEFDYSELPTNGTAVQKGLRIQGSNRSDDLFMFVKRKITGLAPNTRYKVVFQVTFFSNAPEDSVGIGGSPGSSVYMKAGALTQEPVAVTRDNFIELNADKGQQSQSGADLGVIGTIGIAGDGSTYVAKSLASPADFRNVTTDSTGAAWIIVGTDSGYEGLTQLYYSRIQATFTR